MILADAVIGDEGALRPKPQPDPFRNAGKRGGERRPDGAVENPDRLRAMLAQQRTSRTKLMPRCNSDPAC